MKFGGLDIFLERKILDLISLKNPQKSAISTEENEHLKLSKYDII